VEVLGILPIIIETGEILKKAGEQRLENQNFGPQIINRIKVLMSRVI